MRRTAPAEQRPNAETQVALRPAERPHADSHKAKRQLERLVVEIAEEAVLRQVYKKQVVKFH